MPSFVMVVLLFSGYFLGGEAGRASAAALQEQSGTVSGRVMIRPTRQFLRMERGARYRSGASSKSAEAESPNVNEQSSTVIYIEGAGVDGYPATASAKAEMDQKGTEFVPHVLAVHKGTLVDFVNHDKVYHNVFSLSSPRKFNIGRRPTGEAVPIRFDKPGVVQVFCDIHSQMTAFIVVLDNPFFAQPRDDGSYSIGKIPPGTYTVKVWHERLSAPDQKISVSSGGAVTVNFNLE